MESRYPYPTGHEITLTPTSDNEELYLVCACGWRDLPSCTPVDIENAVRAHWGWPHTLLDAAAIPADEGEHVLVEIGEELGKRWVDVTQADYIESMTRSHELLERAVAIHRLSLQVARVVYQTAGPDASREAHLERREANHAARVENLFREREELAAITRGDG